MPRPGIKYFYNGETKTLKQWAGVFNISYFSIWKKFKYQKLTFKQISELSPIKKRFRRNPKAVYPVQREDLSYLFERNEMEIEVVRNECSYFGCSKELSLSESLCGNRCINHMDKKPETFFNSKL